MAQRRATECRAHLPLSTPPTSRARAALLCRAPLLAQGEVVEVRVQVQGEPHSWWEARVLRVRGEFIQVHYLGWEHGKDEYVEVEAVRPARGAAPAPPAARKSELALTEGMHTWLLTHGGGGAIIASVVSHSGTRRRAAGGADGAAPAPARPLPSRLPPLRRPPPRALRLPLPPARPAPRLPRSALLGAPRVRAPGHRAARQRGRGAQGPAAARRAREEPDRPRAAPCRAAAAPCTAAARRGGRARRVRSAARADGPRDRQGRAQRAGRQGGHRRLRH